MHLHSTILAFVMPMEKAWKRTARKQLNGTVRRQKMEMQLRKRILGGVTNMVEVLRYQKQPQRSGTGKLQTRAM